MTYGELESYCSKTTTTQSLQGSKPGPAGMARGSVGEDSQAIPLGIEKNASPHIPYNTAKAKKTPAPNHRNTVQDSLQSFSNTSLFERDLVPPIRQYEPFINGGLPLAYRRSH